VDCEPGSSLILGLKKNLPEGGVAALINNGTILDYVNCVPVKPGDCFCVPAGLLHAIKGGVIIAEVQQSSNVTYRVYDYGRLGPDGKPRQLHTEHAAKVIDASAHAIVVSGPTGGHVREGCRVTDLADWPFFKLSHLDVSGEADFSSMDSFRALLVIEGELTVGGAIPVLESEPTVGGGELIRAKKGACVFIPAGLERYMLRGRGQALLTSL
jgi:mannose-6-phosphate isomerase